MVELTYIVVCQQAWCNETGVGIHFGWDREEFATRKAAIRHGFDIRDSDDFNIGVVQGKRLVSFDWMDRPVGERDETMAEIAKALDLEFDPAGREALTQAKSAGGAG